MPGPPVFGATIDGSCILWQERCGQKGSCLFYSNEKMALYIFLLAASVKLLSLISVILAWKLYKAPDSVISEKSVPAIPEKTKSADDSLGHNDIPSQYVEAIEYKNNKFRMNTSLQNTGENGYTNTGADISTYM